MIFSFGYFLGITGLVMLSLVLAATSFTGDGLIMLDRDENSVHTKRNHGAIFIVILNSDLSLIYRVQKQTHASILHKEKQGKPKTRVCTQKTKLNHDIQMTLPIHIKTAN